MTDDELVETIVATVMGMVVAIHRNSPEQLNDEIATLVRAMIRHRDSLTERASDAALVRAIEVTNGR